MLPTGPRTHLLGEKLLLGGLPDAFQILVSHRRHPRREVVIVMSQQATRHRDVRNMEHAPDPNTGCGSGRPVITQIAGAGAARGSLGSPRPYY
jgi:hypothetical protein